jgi:hypothetical protein
MFEDLETLHMNDPVDIEVLAQRHPEYMSPEKRSLLRYVFDTVCKEAGIFANATEERIELAARILETAKTIDSEYFLIAAGHEAIAEIRARKRFGSR